MKTPYAPWRFDIRRFLWILTMVPLLALAQSANAQTTDATTGTIIQPPPTATCSRTITAKVVAFNQPITFNRLGAVNPVGMMYAL